MLSGWRSTRSRKFTNINTAVKRLQQAGFGFGDEGASPGAFYNFDEVKQRTPDPVEVNTRKPRWHLTTN